MSADRTEPGLTDFHFKLGPEIPMLQHGAGVFFANGKGDRIPFKFPRPLIGFFGSGRIVAHVTGLQSL